MVETYTLNPNLTKTAAVTEWLQQRIDWQIYLPNQRVPSVRKLAKLLDISSFTVVQAYEQLVATNVLIAKPSSGYYVNTQAKLAQPNDDKRAVIKYPVIDTRWLVQQVFSDIPHYRSPGVGTLPRDWVRNDKMEWAIRQVTQQADSFIYDYGNVQGYLPLRQQLVQHLSTQGMQTSTDNVITTAGVSQAVTMAAQLLTQAGDTVLVDGPGWYWLSSCLQQQGLNVIAIERDYQGPNIEQMQKLFAAHRPKLYLTNSVLHNPTSYNLHPARAHQVINLIHEYDAYIFEDDLYAAFVPNNQTLRYASLDQFERVFYATGFSKSMSSGWRVGMLVSPDKFVDDMLRIKTLSNLNTPEFGERVIHRLWTHGEYRRQIKKVQQLIYAAHERLRKLLPRIGLIYPEHTQAGLFVWVDTGQDTGPLALDAYKDGWLVAPGQLFYPDVRTSTYLRLNVSTTNDEFLAWLEKYLDN
ncbi:PLP-dependent aminotransferase family protein [Psychrobacter sp. DAB_AL43B]|uniref:aminotransferase-like domain-containing protein n=1 Tax=Psychrobacter sp. DAB_AL43B TaxID=1028416 RepID=UPI0009A6BB21|nr:PLP-dependent aminotransferase family protein [Psychrobacter sp. DAB_AL43B]SLJ84361.1 GntR family transcriptional regulator [Psychrobacter sp. DAB_AL43B]